MARLRGEASFELDGRTVTLVYDNDAFCAVEDAAGGRSFLEVLEEFQTGNGGRKPRLGSLRALLWAGFVAKHPEVTLSDAGDMIMSGNEAALEAMGKAIEAAMPEAPDDGTANPPKKAGKAGSGKTS